MAPSIVDQLQERIKKQNELFKQKKDQIRVAKENKGRKLVEVVLKNSSVSSKSGAKTESVTNDSNKENMKIENKEGQFHQRATMEKKVGEVNVNVLTSTFSNLLL